MLLYILTTATSKLLELRKRIKGVAGGTSAGKTVSIIQILMDKAQSDTTPTMTSIVSESLPHLKKGAIRDFVSIMQTHKYYDDDRWNRTNFIYTLETGSKIEFFSADQPDKVRGPRRDRLFINEANNIPHETYDQLEVRTREEVWLDWNPTSEFWWYLNEDGGPGVKSSEDCDFITLTYKDNEALDERIVKSIESRKHRKNWWKVYGLGQLGEFEGRIYTGWTIVDEIPKEARLIKYGMDFGYTNDPTSIIAIYEYDGGYIFNEVCYKKMLSNKQIADIIQTKDKALVIADSAEPKSIDEIKSYGVSIIGAAKGKDSVNQGIQYVQDLKISITKRSVNTIKEYRNYSWRTDRNGRRLNQPEDIFNHSMDAIRYGLEPKEEPKFKLAVL